MLKSFFDAARNILSSDASQVRAALAPLDRIEAGLGARAASYVSDGSEANVLLALRPHAAAAGELLGKPGRLYWHHHTYQQDKALQAVADASLSARDALYGRITNTPTDIATLVRLGHVLEAADAGQSLDRTGMEAPDWLQYLLNDALWATLPRKLDASKIDQLVAARPAWDIRLLRALLDEAGLAQAMAMSIVFERRGVDSYRLARVHPGLRAAGPLDEDLLARHDEAAAAARSLSASGKISLLERIGQNPALCQRYTDLILRLAVGDGKTVRASAASLLAQLDRDACHAGFEALLATGQGEERAQAALLLARLRGEAAEAALEAALARESGAGGKGSKAVQEAIRSALSGIRAACDAAGTELPDPPALPAWQETVLADEVVEILLHNREQLLDMLRQSAADEVERNRTAEYKYHFHRDHYARYQKLGTGQLRDALRALNGELDNTAAKKVLSDESVGETVGFYPGGITSRADFGLLQVLRWLLRRDRTGRWLWTSHEMSAWVARQGPDGVDLRQLSEAAVRCGAGPHLFGEICLAHTWSADSLPQAVLPPDRVWPYFAEHPELIDEGLGLARSERDPYEQFDLGQTLAVLDTFPALPARWLPRVMELALGEGKSQRLAAQQIVGKLPDIGKRVVEALGSSKQELRIQAARWLARMDYRAAVPALYAALDKESRETASAELMTALEALGEDLAPRLAPELLLAQARKGLKAKPPAGLAWLALDGLPACRWQDGAVVEPDIIRWWVILAVKLKEPAPNALLLRYLGLLDAPSRAALGRFVLFQFIARDTLHPPLEEAIEHARQHAPGRYQYNQQMALKYPDYYAETGALTEDQVFEQVKREKLGEYLGSAIGEKGLLALVSGMPGHELVDAIRLYMRDHYQRRAQVEAMLDAAAASDDRATIQLLLATARRYRTASVQEKARNLVERIAERNGWTQDQLADRTIPTAGLDETGRMRFEYGAREFSVVLDEKFKPVLHNADGKAIATLPAARQNDAPESIKEGKALFGACKKEVKQVLELQTARLYEAMCAGRVWPAADWDEYLRRHPLAGRMAQRLAWTVLDADGKVVSVFRPTEDGSLIDAADDEVELAPDARIKLAHASLVDAGQAAAWLAHFKDYKVTPLFAQFSRPAPQIADLAADSIDDRLGWMSDTFTLRGAFNKLGYARGSAEDGGVFMEYTKDFAGLGLQVRIAFSGSSLPEENMAAALKTLQFARLASARAGHWGHTVTLDKVPPVLLAEAWHDYHAVAAACQGFDPEWERKVPW